MSNGIQAAVSVIDPAYPVDYSKIQTPPNYKCDECGATGCKLWREYNTFLNYQSLLCAKCAGKKEKKVVNDIDEAGTRRLEDMGRRMGRFRTDQIGWRIPAVPTEENDTYWGYTSVPQAGCEWWRRLPTLSEQAKAELKKDAQLVIEHAKSRQRRGRKPSIAFWGENNPRKALALAHKFAA